MCLHLEPPAPPPCPPSHRRTQRPSLPAPSCPPSQERRRPQTQESDTGHRTEDRLKARSHYQSCTFSYTAAAATAESRAKHCIAQCCTLHCTVVYTALHTALHTALCTALYNAVRHAEPSAQHCKTCFPESRQIVDPPQNTVPQNTARRRAVRCSSV